MPVLESKLRSCYKRGSTPVVAVSQGTKIAGIQVYNRICWFQFSDISHFLPEVKCEKLMVKMRPEGLDHS
jgi:hypothetical protein